MKLKSVMIYIGVISLFNNPSIFPNRKLNEKFLNAVENGNNGRVRKLLKKGANIESKKLTTGHTALMLAVLNNHLSVVKELLDYRPEIDEIDGNQNTALILAATSGNLSIVKELIKNNADISLKNAFGNTALISAAIAGKLDIVGELVILNPPINELKQALKKAALARKLDVVQYLVGNGVSVSASQYQGESTVLNEAASGGCRLIVKYLLEQGAEIDAVDNSNETALIKAACRDHLEVVKELLHNGANIHIKNKEGETALKIATDSRIYDLLRQYVSLEKLRNNLAHETLDITKCLNFSVLNGNFPAVKYLINSFKLNLRILNDLLNKAKNKYSRLKKLNSSEFRLDSFKEIGQLLLKKISIIGVTTNGRLEGTNLPALPIEVVEEVLGWVKVD